MTSVSTPASEVSGHTALSFVIHPIPAEFVTRVRSTLLDDFGRPVEIITAQGGEPMRDQLHRAEAGERIILCSFQSVPLPSIFAEIGPVFISADLSPHLSFTDSLPLGYFNRTFALRAYDAQDRIVESTLVEPAAAPAVIRRLLAGPGVSHLHARFAGHGCFASRIDRA